MNELLKLIFDLPLLSLTQKEENRIPEILEKLQRNDPSVLSQVSDFLSKHIKNDPLPEVLAKWVDVSQSLLTWYKQLINTLTHLGHENVGADFLLELVIALLPNNKARLASIKEKLEQMNGLLNDISTKGYAINMLVSAIHAKIYLSPDLSHLEKKVFSVADRITNDTVIQALVIACEQYKKYLMTIFVDDIKMNHPIFKIYYQFNFEDSVENIFRIIANDVNEGLSLFPDEKPCLIPNDSQLASLFKKLTDIEKVIGVLQYPNKNSFEKLTAFEIKFLPLLSTLQKDHHPETVQLLECVCLNTNLVIDAMPPALDNPLSPSTPVTTPLRQSHSMHSLWNSAKSVFTKDEVKAVAVAELKRRSTS